MPPLPSPRGSALHVAARAGALRCVAHLLSVTDSGALLASQSAAGRLPLHECALLNSFCCVGQRSRSIRLSVFLFLVCFSLVHSFLWSLAVRDWLRQLQVQHKDIPPQLPALHDEITAKTLVSLADTVSGLPFGLPVSIHPDILRSLCLPPKSLRGEDVMSEPENISLGQAELLVALCERGEAALVAAALKSKWCLFTPDRSGRYAVVVAAQADQLEVRCECV